MARKTLGGQALKRKNTLLQTAAQSTIFQKEINDSTDISAIPETNRDKILYLDDDMLIDDPLNVQINGENDEKEIEDLAQSMRTYGFQGLILAYPYNGKYQIESGHRRREAARRAGITTYTVYMTETPKSDWERRMRLHLGNLHTRKEKPMRIARIAQDLYLTHQMEIKEKKEKNLLEDGAVTSLNELVAADLSMDFKSIQKYRALIKLIPELQEMADSEEYSWSALSGASTLNEDMQKKLVERILTETERVGMGNVNRPWITKTINILRQEQNNEKIPNAQPNNNPKSPRRKSSKILLKYASSLDEILSSDPIIKKTDVDEVLSTLEQLQKKIDEKISFLKKDRA